MPIYLVKTQQGELLVEANSRSQAISHVVKTTIEAAVVTASDVVKLMQDGVVVEKAGNNLSQHTETKVAKSADDVCMAIETQDNATSSKT